MMLCDLRGYALARKPSHSSAETAANATPAFLNGM